MSKLILEEDEIMPEVEAAPEPSEDEALMAVNSMISNLIQNKWQAIDLLNGNITALQQYNRPDVTAVLTDMISDNYIHIGQLEKVLEMNNSGAANIEAGKEDIEGAIEATDNLDDVEVDVEPVEENESLKEDKALVKFAVGPDHPLYDKAVPAEIQYGVGYDRGQVYGKALDPVEWPEKEDGLNVFDKKGNYLRSEKRPAYTAPHEGYVDEVIDELPEDDVDEELVLRTNFKKPGVNR